MSQLQNLENQLNIITMKQNIDKAAYDKLEAEKSTPGKSTPSFFPFGIRDKKKQGT